MSKTRSKTEVKVPKIQKLSTPMQQNIKCSKLRQQNLQFKDELSMGQQIQQNQSQIVQQNETEKISTMVSKLISKNKINSKNAFNVPLVSIRQLTSFKQENDSSWSKISQTLENSSKIYGFRVDSVTDNINRMTNSMMRSILKQQQENRLEHSYSQCRVSDNKFQCQESLIEQHLEQGKLKSQQYFIQPRPDMNRLRSRRLLDSGGVKGLILATIPIQSNFAISMLQQNYEQQRISVLKKTNCEDWLVKIVSQFKFNQMMIMQQIRRSANQILNMGKNNCSISIQIESQSLQDETFNHLLQNVAQQVGSVSLYSLEIIKEDQKMFHSSSYVQKPTYCEQTIWEDSVIKWNGSKKLKNKPIPKHNGIKIDKQKANSQKVTEHEISFLPFQQKQKEQTIHKARKYDKIKKSTRQIVQRNLIPSVTTNFKLHVIGDCQQNKQDFKEDSHYIQMSEEQLVKFEEYSQFADKDKKQINQIKDIDHEKQAQMMSNIRQIKQQLQRILELGQQVGLKIKFSELYQQHQRMTNLVGLNESIDFLSVLHLGNQNDYFFQQIDHSDFYISKQ